MSHLKFNVSNLNTDDLSQLQVHEVRMHNLNNTRTLYGHLFTSLGVLAATGAVSYLFTEYVFPSIFRLNRCVEEIQKEINKRR